MTDQQRERIKTLSMASRRASEALGICVGCDRPRELRQAQQVAEDAHAALMAAIYELEVPDAR